MAGGGGTRLWPASTRDRPKQLLEPRLQRMPSSLLQSTLARVGSLAGPEQTWVVTTADQRAGVVAALPGVPATQILAEPMGRNTAPCIALGLRHLRAQLGADVSATVIALPADHLVSDVPEFQRHLETACVVAEAHRRIVTLGIRPSRPDTGYGYIEQHGQPHETRDGIPVFPVRRFVEKPDLARAQEFLDTGHFHWNAGIFIMPLEAIETAFTVHCAETWAALAGVAAADDVERATAEAYARIDPAPIDTAVMEKLKDLLVIPIDVGWTDLGSWKSVLEVADRDDRKNAVITGARATTVLQECTDSLVWNEDGTVGVMGLTGVAVVVSRGKVLVCPVDQAQRVRKLVAELPERER